MTASTRRAALALSLAFGHAAAAVRAGDDPVTVPGRRAASDEGDRLLAAAAAARTIDREVDRVLAAEGLKPSGPSDDAEYLRRVSLDLLGVPPTESQVRAFLASKDPGKRAAKVEELLADPLFGEHLAELWSRLLFTDLKRYLREHGIPVRL